MTPTRMRWLVALGVATAALTWLVLRQVYTDLAPLPWTPVPTLVLLGLVEAWAGRGLRVRLASRSRTGQNGDRSAVRTRPLSPIAIARTAALAKASAHAGAVIAGLGAGFAIYLAVSLSKSVPRPDLFPALGIFVGAMILIAGALYLERSCRVPKDPDDDRDQLRVG